MASRYYRNNNQPIKAADLLISAALVAFEPSILADLLGDALKLVDSEKKRPLCCDCILNKRIIHELENARLQVAGELIACQNEKYRSSK